MRLSEKRPDTVQRLRLEILHRSLSGEGMPRAHGNDERAEPWFQIVPMREIG